MTIPLWLTLPFAGGAALAVIAVLAAMSIVAIGSARSRQAPDAAQAGVAAPLAPRAQASPEPSATRPPAATGESASGAPTGADGARLASLDRRFEAARALRDLGDPAQAFAELATLADEGHCEAARMARQLIHAGPEVYLMSFRAGPKQISRWRKLPGCWPGALVR